MYFCNEMTNLSVNINKVATLRNARGGSIPNVVQVALDCEKFGAQGITVHPRPDERHIRRSDVFALKPVLATEFNIEGNPTSDFIEMVLSVLPAQVTLVPDAHHVLTSDAGWDTVKHRQFLTEVVKIFHTKGIRVSIFVNANPAMVEGTALTDADRVELYTEPYAAHYPVNPEEAVYPFVLAAGAAAACGLGVNAGHDLNLQNVGYFVRQIPNLLEVSIGHALISEALYLGLESTIKRYLAQIKGPR
jgi:pyridoxine 5-phosphate synthase